LTESQVGGRNSLGQQARRPGGIISLQGGGIIQESLGAIIPLQTGGFIGIGTRVLAHQLASKAGARLNGS
jgi:hypothetical protein